VATIRVFKHYLRVPFLLLGTFEVAVLIASVYVAAYIRFETNTQLIGESIGPLLPRALVFAATINLAMIAMGLYQARLREGMSGIMLRTAVSFLVGGMGLALLFYIIPSLFTGRGTLALAGILSFFVIGTLRPIFFDTLDETALKQRVLIYGSGETAASIMRRLRRRSDYRSFTILGYVHLHGQRDVVPGENVIRTNLSLLEYAREHEVDEIVVAIDDRRKGFSVNQLLDCKMSGIEVIDILTFFEREAGRIRIDMLNPSWLVFSDGFQQNFAKLVIKRVFDTLVSLVILLMAWPIMLITAFAIAIEGPWRAPILYRQVRVGEQGKPFKVLKFRSMRIDAESGGARWATENDSRVTAVGGIIRKLRIDELPQIFNVLAGDMSFVGPRPERPEFVLNLSERVPYYAERHRVKPGITGWAQLCYPYGASEYDAVEKQQYDLYYVKNHSLFLDLLIILQTAEVVLFGKGAR